MPQRRSDVDLVRLFQIRSFFGSTLPNVRSCQNFQWNASMESELSGVLIVVAKEHSGPPSETETVTLLVSTKLSQTHPCRLPNFPESSMPPIDCMDARLGTKQDLTSTEELNTWTVAAHLQAEKNRLSTNLGTSQALTPPHSSTRSQEASSELTTNRSHLNCQPHTHTNATESQ